MIELLDTTFREGRQSYLSRRLSGKILEYANLLGEIGIQYMEVAHPFNSLEFLGQFRALVREKQRPKVVVHSALVEENFRRLVKEGITFINTSIKFSDSRIIKLDDTILELSKAIQGTRQCSKDLEKISVRVGIEYAFHYSLDNLLDYCKKSLALEGVDRIGLSDTDGSVVPEKVKETLSRLDACFPSSVSIELHFHNDSGLAAANFYEVYKLFRASPRRVIVHVSAEGIGERNGILSIGDVLSLEYLLDKENTEKAYKLELYGELCSLIFEDGVSFNRDPINPMAFAHSSGVHIARFLKTGEYQGIDPQVFGHVTTLVINESFSSEAVSQLAKARLGLDLEQELASELAVHIRALSVKNDLTENDVIKLIKAA